MSFIKFGLVFLVLAVSLCLAERPIDDYLYFTQKTPTHQQELSWIAAKVASLGDVAPDTVADFISRAAVNLDSLVKGKEVIQDDTGVSSYEKERAYRLLDALSQLHALTVIGNKLACSEYNMQFFLEMAKLSSGSVETFIKMVLTDSPPEHNATLFNFLKHYGLEQYFLCLNDVESRFSKVRHYIDKTSEDLFDNVVSLGQEQNDVWLANKAEELDFTNGKFDARTMLAEIKKRYTFEPSRVSSADRFSGFMSFLCSKIRSPSSGLFDLYNFARAINPIAADKLKMPPRFRKLNEYSRLCSELMVEQVNQLTFDNIRKNMDNVWYKKIVNLV